MSDAPGSERRERLLRELGLSEYAARAYLALLELGPAEARDIARLAKVPIAKVYSTLDQLALKGFALILPETPRKYAPQRMGDVMKRIAAEHAARAEETAARVAQMDELFQLARRDHASDRGTTIILRGRRAVNEKLTQLAQGSKDVLLLASDGFSPRIETTLAGASPRVLTIATAEGLAAHGRTLPNRRGAPNPATFAVFDDDAALLAHHVPDDKRQHEGLDVAILVHEQAIVRALRDLLEQAWARTSPPDAAAMPLRAAREEA